MGLFLKAKEDLFQNKEGLSELEIQQREIEKRIADLTQKIESEPERLRREQEQIRTMMPAPDDLEDRRREKKFYAHVTRGEAVNERRYQAKRGLLLLLIVSATAALCWWIYSFLQVHL